MKIGLKIADQQTTRQKTNPQASHKTEAFFYSLSVLYLNHANSRPIRPYRDKSRRRTG